MVFLKDLCRPHVSELCNDNSPETKSDPIVSNSFFFFLLIHYPSESRLPQCIMYFWEIAEPLDMNTP